MEKFKNIPIWLVVIAFIFAWPVGLVLVILKYASKEDSKYEKVNNGVSKPTIINTNKSAKLDKLKKKKSIFKVLTIIQFVIAIVFFCALISDIAEEDDNIEGGIMVNVFTFGILTPLCITYFKTNSLVKKIETYQNLILIRDIYDTKKLASYLGTSRMQVLDFVSYMIREGYLDLDIENENIVKPKEYVDPAQIFSIVCQSCGATNKFIKGKNNKCEYCGNVLNLNKI